MQRLVVLALGKLGGGELNFSSDVDLVLAYRRSRRSSDGARPLDAEIWYSRLGQHLVSLLAERTCRRLRLSRRSAPASVRQCRSRRAFVFGDGAVLPARRPRLGALRLDQGAAGGRRQGRRQRVARDPAPVRVPPLSRLHRVRRPARDEGADRRRSRAQGSRRASQARSRRHSRDRVHRAARAADPRRSRARVARARPVAGARGLRATRPDQCRARRKRLRDAYRFLRRLENRVQMFADQQTHEMPDDALAAPAHRARPSAMRTGPRSRRELDRHRAAVSEEFDAA